MADSLAGLQDAIEAFVAERDWAQFHTPKNLAMGVAIEAAEIMEHFLWSSGEESRSLTPQKRTEVANEIGDVLIYLLRLARTLDAGQRKQRRGTSTPWVWGGQRARRRHRLAIVARQEAGDVAGARTAYQDVLLAPARFGRQRATAKTLLAALPGSTGK